MRIEFDPVKSAENEKERGLPFDMVPDLEWSRARVFEDKRFDYGEKRMIAMVPLKGRLYVVCYTQRVAIRRIIRFRKANKREEKAYGQTPIDR